MEENLPTDLGGTDIGFNCELGEGTNAGEAAIWLLQQNNIIML